ncbi:MAG TPA: hypothetical protein VGB63_13435, partial [Pedobacter sp.]
YQKTIFSIVSGISNSRIIKKIVFSDKHHIALGDANQINYTQINRIIRAINFIDQARRQQLFLVKITMYISALETLFIAEKTKDEKVAISMRVGAYLQGALKNKQQTKGSITEAYNIRSKYIHGTDDDLLNDKKIKNICNKIDNILRLCFQRILKSDKALFQDSVLLPPFLRKLDKIYEE